MGGPMKVCLSLFTVVLTLLTLLGGNALSEEASNEKSLPTLVMTDIIVHDNLYASSQEAIKFTELLQIVLMEKTPYDWVSRDKVEEALKELKMDSFGRLESSSSLEIGKWVQADLLLKGDACQQKDNDWLVLIEVIDLAHADIICEIGLRFSGSPNKPFSFEPGDEEAAYDIIAPALKQVIEVLEKQKSKVRIAPLFFQNKEPGGRLDFYEEEIRVAFAKNENPNIKFIQFPKASESIQEAELAVTVLVESNPDSWQKLADYYVWGTYEEVESSGISFDNVTVKATITVWDGISKPKEFSETGIVSELSSLSKKIVEKVAELSQEKSEKQPQTSIRSEIAHDLTERAKDIMEFVLQIEYENSPNISDTWWKRRNHAIQLLSVASFFDPSNENIRTTLLVEKTRDDIDELRKVQSALFWRKYNRCIAWKKHCDKFGFNYEHKLVYRSRFGPAGARGDNRLFRGDSADMYLYPLMELLDEGDDIVEYNEKLLREIENWKKSSPKIAKNLEFDRAKKIREMYSDLNVPMDLPVEIFTQWYLELSSDYHSRVYKIATQCPEKVKGHGGDYLLAMLRLPGDSALKFHSIEGLWEYAKRDTSIWHAKDEVEEKLLTIYAKEGNIERAKELIAMLPQEDVREIRKLPGGGTYITTKKHLREKYGLQLIEDKKTKKKETPKSGYDRFGDKISVKVDYNKTKTIKISDNSIPTKDAMIDTVSLNDIFWVQATTAMEFARGRIWMAVQGQKKNRQMDQGSGILLHDFRRNRTLDLAKKFGKHSEVTSMLLDDNILWVTFSADGVWAIDTRSLNVQKYTAKEGLTSNEMHCSALFNNKLFFGGGREQTASLCAINKDTQEWIKYDLPTTSKNNNDGTYYHLTEMASNEKWLALYSHYGGSGTHVLLFNIALNKWFEMGKKLLSEEAGFCHFGEGERLFVLGLDIDSNGLWITTSRGIALLSLETMEYEYKCLSTKKITSCISDNQYIWIARVNTEFKRSSTEGDQDCRVLCFDKNSNKWLYDIKVPYEGKVDKMIKIEDVLWLGMSSHKNSLISISISENSQLKPGSNRSISH